MSLKILFFGTRDNGVPFLKGLLGKGSCEVVGVVVPAQKRTPKQGLRAHLGCLRSAVLARMKPVTTTQMLARQVRLPVWDKELSEPAFSRFVAGLSPDLFVVASFSRILKPETLSLAPLGVVNVHPSLLPKYRGADPIFWAMLNDEKVTGITIHWMDTGLDTGPIICQREIEIPTGMDAVELTAMLTSAGVELLAEALDQIENGLAASSSQDERLASYFPPASEKFRTIYWEDSADAIQRLVRASAPYGGALAQVEYQHVKILKVEQTEKSTQWPPGKVLRRNNKWVDISCRDAVLRLLLAGGRA